MISWDRNIRHSHSCIKSSSYWSGSHFLIWNYMYGLHFFLLIDRFKDNIWVITIRWWIFKVKKLVTFFGIILVVHRKWEVAHFTSNYSPLIRIGWISWSGFSFGINPHFQFWHYVSMQVILNFRKAYLIISIHICVISVLTTHLSDWISNRISHGISNRISNRISN